MRTRHMNKYLRYVTQVALIAIVAGCASVDFDNPKSDSCAL
jgi:hypothetical protein